MISGVNLIFCVTVLFDGGGTQDLPFVFFCVSHFEGVFPATAILEYKDWFIDPSRLIAFIQPCCRFLKRWVGKQHAVTLFHL